MFHFFLRYLERDILDNFYCATNDLLNERHAYISGPLGNDLGVHDRETMGIPEQWIVRCITWFYVSWGYKMIHTFAILSCYYSNSKALITPFLSKTFKIIPTTDHSSIMNFCLLVY